MELVEAGRPGIRLRCSRQFSGSSLGGRADPLGGEAGLGGQMVWHGQTIVLMPCR
jgi:hypothetical protein